MRHRISPTLLAFVLALAGHSGCDPIAPYERAQEWSEPGPRCRPNWDGTGFNACTGEGRPVEPPLEDSESAAAARPDVSALVHVAPATMNAEIRTTCWDGLGDGLTFPIVSGRLRAMVTAPPGTIVDVLSVDDGPIVIGRSPTPLSVDLRELVGRASGKMFPFIGTTLELEIRVPGHATALHRMSFDLDGEATRLLARIARGPVRFASDTPARATRDALAIMIPIASYPWLGAVARIGEDGETLADLPSMKQLTREREGVSANFGSGPNLIADIDLIATVSLSRNAGPPHRITARVTVYDRRTGAVVARRRFDNRALADTPERFDYLALEAWLGSFLEAPPEGVAPDSDPADAAALMARGGLQDLAATRALPSFAKLRDRMAELGANVDLDTDGIFGGLGARFLGISYKGESGFLLHLDGSAGAHVEVGPTHTLHVEVKRKGQSDRAATRRLLAGLRPAGVVSTIEDVDRVMRGEGWQTTSPNRMIDGDAFRGDLLVAIGPGGIAVVTLFSYDPTRPQTSVIASLGRRVLIVALATRSRALFDKLVGRIARADISARF